jgi:hypothetical protein
MSPHVTRTRFPLVSAAAISLGVSRATLFRAVSGRWPNPGLVAGYQKFIEKWLIENLPPATTEQPSPESPDTAKPEASSPKTSNPTVSKK